MRLMKFTTTRQFYMNIISYMHANNLTHIAVHTLISSLYTLINYNEGGFKLKFSGYHSYVATMGQSSFKTEVFWKSY